MGAIRPNRVSVQAYIATTLGAGLIYGLLVPTLFGDARPAAVFWGLGVTVAVVFIALLCIDERRPRWLWERRRR